MTVHFNSFEEFEGLAASEVWYERADGTRYRDPADMTVQVAKEVTSIAKQGAVQSVQPLVTTVERAVQAAKTQAYPTARLMLRADRGQVPWLAIGGVAAAGMLAAYLIFKPKRRGLSGLRGRRRGR